MADPFATYTRGLDSPANNWLAKVTAATAVTFSTRPRALFICTAGNVEMVGDNGVTVVFPVLASQVLPCSPISITVNTTSDVIPMW